MKDFVINILTKLQPIILIYLLVIHLIGIFTDRNHLHDYADIYHSHDYSSHSHSHNQYAEEEHSHNTDDIGGGGWNLNIGLGSISITLDNLERDIDQLRDEIDNHKLQSGHY